jgi:pyrimidine-specific ribonucleoside hydrolase
MTDMPLNRKLQIANRKSILTSLVVFLFALPSLAAIPVWLDVDCSAGLVIDRPRDVDDALALIQAFHSPEIEVVGISAVFGNAPLEACLPITKEIVEKFGPANMPVHPGAASSADLGKTTPATTALIAALEAASPEKPLTLLPLGPVTNIATVLQQRPDLAPHISQIVICAARRPGFDFHPPGRPELKFPDANFEKDAPAMQVLLDSPVTLVFAGYESSANTWLTRADLDSITHTPTGKYLRDISQAWLIRWETVRNLPGFNPFDTLCVFYVTHPDRLAAIPVTTLITTGPNDRNPDQLPATQPSKPYLLCLPAPANVRTRHLYITHTPQNITPLLVERLAARPSASKEPRTK